MLQGNNEMPIGCICNTITSAKYHVVSELICLQIVRFQNLCMLMKIITTQLSDWQTSDLLHVFKPVIKSEVKLMNIETLHCR